MRKVIIICLLLVTLQAEDEYRLGEGIQVGELPLYIGGYFSADYRVTENEDRYRLDDIALLTYGSYDKFSYMMELEFKEFYVNTNKKNEQEISQNRQLYIERLYVDYSMDENYMFRVGKYNSPIGFWNLLPINVLKETSSNPMSTAILYPTFTTGAMLSYSTYNSGEFNINVILQHNDDFDSEYNNYKSDKHYGFGLSYEKDNYTLKLNGGYFHKNDTKLGESDLYYTLLSAKYESDSYQFLVEAGRQRSKEKVTTNYAGFAQGLYRFTQEHIAVVRAEAYETDARNSMQEEFMVVGYTYRPLYPIAIKSEYQFHSQSELNRALFSLSVLF